MSLLIEPERFNVLSLASSQCSEDRSEGLRGLRAVIDRFRRRSGGEAGEEEEEEEEDKDDKGEVAGGREQGGEGAKSTPLYRLRL